MSSESLPFWGEQIKIAGAGSISIKVNIVTNNDREDHRRPQPRQLWPFDRTCDPGCVYAYYPSRRMRVHLDGPRGRVSQPTEYHWSGNSRVSSYTLEESNLPSLRSTYICAAGCEDALKRLLDVTQIVKKTQRCCCAHGRSTYILPNAWAQAMGLSLIKESGSADDVRTGWCDSYSKRSRSDSPRILRLMRRRSRSRHLSSTTE